MQKILKWFAPIIALGVAIFIIFFLVSINSSSKLSDIEPLSYQSEVVHTDPQELWLNHFSKTEKLGYSYPVNEVYIKVNLDEDIVSARTRTSIYKLSASILDPYQLFCLKEELSQHRIQYYLQRDKNGLELLIYSKNISQLNSLVQVLKNYQISAKVMPYKEDV